MSENKSTKNAAMRGRRLVALSAPSGAGKSTICHYLLARNPEFRLSISATTRPRRKNEADGVHYFFLSPEAFEAKIKAGEFLEFEKVHGNFYGTLKSTVDTFLREGRTVLFDIDVNGALNIKSHFPDALLIFIKPPSMDELARRLKNRKTEDRATIARRLKRLPKEYAKAELFDAQVVNDDLFRAIKEIEQIILAHQNIKK